MGLRENLQETPIFDGKDHGSLPAFLKPNLQLGLAWKI